MGRGVLFINLSRCCTREEKCLYAMGGGNRDKAKPVYAEMYVLGSTGPIIYIPVMEVAAALPASRLGFGAMCYSGNAALFGCRQGIDIAWRSSGSQSEEAAFVWD